MYNAIVLNKIQSEYTFSYADSEIDKRYAPIEHLYHTLKGIYGMVVVL